MSITYDNNVNYFNNVNVYHVHSKLSCFQLFFRKAGHTQKVGPGTRDPGRLQVGPLDPGPRTPKCLGGIQDPGPPKWDPGLQNI